MALAMCEGVCVVVLCVVDLFKLMGMGNAMGARGGDVGLGLDLCICTGVEAVGFEEGVRVVRFLHESE